MTAPEIHIYGPHSILKGDYPVSVVRTATSYPVEGAEFSKAYRKGLWDGRTHLFNKKTGSFPTGLVSTVRTVVEQNLGTEIAVIDHRTEPTPQGRSFDLVGVKMEGKYSYQLDACKTMVKQKQGVVKISTNGGKCLGKNTPVMLHDGSIKLVQDITVGDLLMGPDSKPRRVLSTTTGIDDLYLVLPDDQVNFMSWVCNSVHILSLRNIWTGAVVDIGLNEYKKAPPEFKNSHELFSVSTGKETENYWLKCTTRFSIHKLEHQGTYYGFTLEGDRRFVLADGTVTHNTEISCAVTQYLGLQTLFLVSTQELLYQARERFKKRLGLNDQEVGIIGDGEWSPGSWITIAMIPTLESRIDTEVCQEFLKSIDVLFIDEAHHAGSETWYTVCSLCPAYYRFGLSGTPMDRTDGANLRLLATTGDVIVNISNKYLVENGISAKAEIIFDKITEPVLDKKKKFAYPTVYKQVISENPVHLKKVVDWTKIFVELGLGTLILVEEIQHGKMIDDALWTQAGDMFIPHMYIHGSAESEERQKALADFAAGNLPVLISSKILDEGVDVPTIDALILAGSRKSRIKTMQRLGRGLRGNKLIVVEFANYCHKYTIEHSLERLADYKKEECFDIYTSGPDIELVRKLWNKDGSNG